MQNKEFKRHIAYEVLTILGTLALLLFVCRLWPILLLVILGIFIAAMRLLFLSARKVENIPPLLPAARPEPTDQDIRDMAFGSMQRRITELVTAEFPNARWVWKTPNAMRNIATGNEVRILLNHAGGYREAIVVIRGLQVCSLTYPHAEEVKMPETENDETGTEETEDDTPQKVDPPENYEYLAFEWVDAHVMELNERCNESIAQGLSMLEITVAELPARESWPDICRELEPEELEYGRLEAEYRVLLAEWKMSEAYWTLEPGIPDAVAAAKARRDEAFKRWHEQCMAWLGVYEEVHGEPDLK